MEGGNVIARARLRIGSTEQGRSERGFGDGDLVRGGGGCHGGYSEVMNVRMMRVEVATGDVVGCGYTKAIHPALIP